MHTPTLCQSLCAVFDVVSGLWSPCVWCVWVGDGGGDTCVVCVTSNFLRSYSRNKNFVFVNTFPTMTKCFEIVCLIAWLVWVGYVCFLCVCVCVCVCVGCVLGVCWVCVGCVLGVCWVCV